MLLAPPPRISTDPPSRAARGGTTLRQASARLSLAAASRSAGTPAGTGTSMWSAKGTRISSAIMPPQGPLAGPNPNAARVRCVVVEHLDVRPRRQRSQEPHETAHGTTTRSPTRTRSTLEPTATTSATHSWPIANGSLKGTLPHMHATTGSIARSAIPAWSARDTGRWIGSVSPSQRAATNGRTSASPGSASVGGSRSCQARRPLRSRWSSRTQLWKSIPCTSSGMRGTRGRHELLVGVDGSQALDDLDRAVLDLADVHVHPNVVLARHHLRRASGPDRDLGVVEGGDDRLLVE